MGCHGKHREARSARLAPRQKRGCSGGLIMLASAWKREASPVARGEIAGRLCGQVAGEGAWRLRWFGEGEESAGCWWGVWRWLRHSQGK
jgi:hypothetical protein